MDYAQKAICWAERYGIVKYRVKGNKMIYNRSYPAYLNEPAYTIQHTVNLDTMTEEHTKRLKRLDREGFYNRG